MTQIKKVYFIPSLGQEISDFLTQTVPTRRRRKVARYLQHFDLWLRHTHYKSLSESLLPPEAYVYFYLSHISLYPGPEEPTEPRDYYLRLDIDNLLINRKLKGLGRLTSRQAASRVSAAMNWQEHCFGKNLDSMRTSMKKLYHQAKYFAHATELTAKSKLYSADFLELVSETCRGIEHWVRDLAMFRLLQETRCTTSDLAGALCADLTRLYNDEWCFKYGNDRETCLSEGTATLIQILLGRHHHHLLLEKYRDNHQHLFSMGDAQVEFKMSANDVDVVLERRYRFALMLTSVNCQPDINLYLQGANPFPEGFVSEQTVFIPHLEKFKKVVNLQFSVDLNNAPEHSASESMEALYFYVDWDAAIRNSTMVLPAPAISGASGVNTKTQNANLRNNRVLIAGEDIDQMAWANWGED